MSFLKRTLVFVTALLSVVLITIYFWLKYLLPDYSGEKKISGIQNNVKVYFDEYAIPHIYAKTNKDAWTALGYIHVQDRLFQMELLRRVGSGRLSEIFGKDLIKADKLFRALSIGEVAKRSVKDYFNSGKDPYQELTLAYLNGINNYIENGKTPIEFTLLGIEKEKFTVEDVYLISGYMAFSFAEAFRTDPVLTSIKNSLGGDYLKDILVEDSLYHPKNNTFANDTIAGLYENVTAQLSQLLDMNPVPSFIGSNAWAVSSERSASGKVLFCNDTHIGYSSPCVWYEAHIETSTDTVYGNFLAGFPFPLIGHTKHHTWGLTMFENDDLNFYMEKQNPSNAAEYLYNNESRPYSTREEIINVKNEHPVTFQIKATHHGAVINNIVEEVDSSYSNPVSVYWSYNHFPATNIQAAYGMCFAKNIKEMEKSVSFINAPGLNIIYGDIYDNIAWWTAAKVLLYNHGVNTRLVLDGSSSYDEPVDTLSFDQNPHSVNPPIGYVYSSNNCPSTPGSKIIQGYYAPPDRAIDITNFLNHKEKLSLDDLKYLQVSSVNSSQKVLARIIVSILEGDTALSEIQKNCLSELKSWDGNHNKGSIAPTIFYTVFSFIMKNTLADEIGIGNYNKLVNGHTLKTSYAKLLKNNDSKWWDNKNTPEKESRKDVMHISFEQAINVLREKSATPEGWKWENFHTLEHPHALGRQKPLDKFFNVNVFGINGGNETVNNAGFNLDTTAAFKTKYGPAMRIALDFADLDSGYNCLPTGQSGYFFSNHYDDQSVLYIQNTYRLMQLNKKVITKTNKHLTLIPN